MIETESGPRRSRLRRDRAGQSAPVAVALLLGITLLGTGTVLVLGSGAFADARASAEHERAEQSMTVLDARAADVALGDSPSERVRLGPSGDGSYAVDEDAGWINVTHRNATGDGGDETLYSGSLGAVTYRDGGTTVAYQGGGVWRRQGGGTVMASPPEFHYRTDTLTLPIISIRGSDGISGDATAEIADGRTERVYPNANATYNGIDRRYVNPLQNGTVAVTVRSDYYEGWAEYFRTRTAGNVTVDHGERTATVELIAPGTFGRFERIRVRGMPDEHAVETFDVSIGGYETKNGKVKRTNLNNLDFAYRASNGPKRLEIGLRVAPGSGQKICRENKDADIGVSIEYRNDSEPSVHHRWTGTVDAESGPIRVNCAEKRTLEANLTTDDVHLSFEGDSLDAGAQFDHAADDGSAADETAPLGRLVRHYLAELAEVDSSFTLIADYEHSKNRVVVGNSRADFDYRYAEGKHITYLHVTENDVRVDLD